jgi:hypothetical protein
MSGNKETEEIRKILSTNGNEEKNRNKGKNNVCKRFRV